MSLLADKTVLVTGGAGAFGTAFCRYALEHGVRRCIAYSTDEEKHRKLKVALPDDRLDCFIGDVRDLSRLRMALEADVDYVIHAAALKQVPACERDPMEATKTNVIGAMNIVEAACAAVVDRVVFLSTDKSPEASTVYGKTKALAETIIVRGNTYAGRRTTRFAATRYGNVIASTGSVIPVFLEQRKRGVLTVTDREATRFWMYLREAVDLVIWTLAHMSGGEVVVPKVQSARVVDLAKAIGPECAICETGLRPTEKLHEVLIAQDEVCRTYDYGDVYVVAPADPTWAFVLPIHARKVAADFQYGSNDQPAAEWPFDLEAVGA